jgi:nucleoside-diphosphate-sugar epimerase
MKVFVTGATGVVGRRVVPRLVADGHRVSAVARSAESAARVARAGASAVRVDLFDHSALATAVAGHDAVVNLATHIPRSSLRMLLPGAWRENDRIRRFVSATLANAADAGGAGRYVQESFAAAYPDAGRAWIDEDTRLAPARYNRTLVDAEASAERFTRSGRIGVVLRFASFYGPDAFQTQDLARFARHGFAALPGVADAYVSSVSHDDAAAAVIAALRAPAGIYNVADDEPLTRRDYFDALAQALDVAPPRLQPAWAARLLGSLGELLARSQRVANRKLRATGWTPAYPSVRDGWREIFGAAGAAAPDMHRSQAR